MSSSGPLVDGFGRTHTDLRISVTDRCNIRCQYCMPAEGVEFRSHAEILSYEEIERFVRVAAQLGIRQLRLTGGEPLVRKHVARLVEMLAALPGIDEIAMTTNGVLLDRCAGELKAAGLRRLNISLDTVDPRKYQEITRRDELPAVLRGIAAARGAGFERIKLNAVAIRDFSEAEIVPLALFARENDLELRFIEFMPADGNRRWSGDRVLPGEAILEILGKGVGPLEPASAPDSQAPATEYRYLDGKGRVGLIPSVTKPFCDRCDRLRLTADGKLRDCLFSTSQWDARALLRDGTEQQLAELICSAVRAKQKTRGSSDGEFLHTDRPMHQIGG